MAHEVIFSPIPFYALLVPLIAAGLILLSTKYPNLREFWTIIASVTQFFLVTTLIDDVIAGRTVEFRLIEISPGIDLSFRADVAGMLFAVIASGLWILTSVYSIGYMRGLLEKKQTRYFACFAAALSATMGVAFAANLLTFLLFYEILTIVTYPLVIHKETREAIVAGRKYLAYTLSAGVLLVFVIGWTYLLVGDISFRAGGWLNLTFASKGDLQIIFLLFLVGVGVKSAIMPLHSWLPSAMIAPTPVSALLHAVAVVKAGVFGVVRIVGYVFTPSALHELGLVQVQFVLAGATIILASLLALREDNLKRRLAYSTIGHLSYIVLGFTLITPHALAGGLLHLASHAIMKITLFFCAGAIYVNLHKENVSELDGVGLQMPITMSAFAIASLGLVGIPPLNGFVSKFYLGLGAVESHHSIALFVLMLSGLLNAGYLFPIVYRSFRKSNGESPRFNEASWLMVVPLAIAAFFSVFFGLFPDHFLSVFTMAQQAANEILRGTP